MAILIQAADYPIKSVTVFKSSKAEVVRTFKLSLHKGQNKVDVSGLSSTIDTESVRISGLGDARLLDIVTTVKSDSVEDVSPTCSAEVIRTLEEKISALESATSIREQESALLTRYGETLTGEHVSPVQMDSFLTTYIDREKKALEETLSLKEEILKLQRRLTTEKEKASSKKGAAHGHVDAVLFTDTDTRIEMTLTYIVSDTSWKPTYELHATTENGRPSSSVTLHYRARIKQSTGEDWSNTTLTLSTVSSDTVARQIPHLRPVTLQKPSSGFRGKKVKQTNVGPVFFVSNNLGPGAQKSSLFGHTDPKVQQQQALFGQQQQQQLVMQQQQQQQYQAQGHHHQQADRPAQNFYGGSQPPPPFGSTISAFGNNIGGASGGGGFGAPPGGYGFPQAAPVIPDAPNEELHDEEFEELIEGPDSDPITIVTETPMAISFSVNGESNIPSDGVDHQVSVAVLPFSAKISYIAIPRIEPRVFLQCEVKNTSEYRLLPGPVFVILDDSYVSKTTINDVNTGDDFECNLGDDASAKVTYERTSKTVKSDGGTFSEVTNTTTYTTKISIHNKHQFPINDLIVRDVIPTCEDKRLKIVLRKPKGLADAKDGQWVDVTDDGLRVGWEKVVDGKGGEKEGRFEWRWKVDTGAKVNLHAEWEVKAPGEIAWLEAF